MAPKPNQSPDLAGTSYSPSAAGLQRFSQRKVVFGPGYNWKRLDQRPSPTAAASRPASYTEAPRVGRKAERPASDKVADAASRIVACMAAVGPGHHHSHAAAIAIGLPHLPAIRSRQWEQDLQAMKEEIMRRPETLGLAMLLIAAVAPIQAVAAASEAHLQTALGVVSLAIFNTLRPGVRRTLLHRVPPLSAAPATAPEKVADPSSHRLSIDSCVSAPSRASRDEAAASAASSVANFVTAEDRADSTAGADSTNGAQANMAVLDGLAEATARREAAAPAAAAAATEMQPKPQPLPHAELVDDLSKQVMAMQQDLLAVMGEYERAEMELSAIMRDAKAAEGEIPVLDAEIRSLEAQLLSLKALREAQQQQLSNAARADAELVQEEDAQTGPRETGFARRDNVVGQMEGLKRQLEDIVGQVEREQDQLLDMREGVLRAEEEIPALDAEIEALEAQRNLMAFKAGVSVQGVPSPGQQESDLRAEFSAVQQEACALEVAGLKRELEAVASEVEREREALVALSSEVEEVEMEVPALDAEIEALRAQKKYLEFQAAAAGSRDAEVQAVDSLQETIASEGLSGEERKALSGASAEQAEALRRDLAAVEAEVEAEGQQLETMLQETEQAEKAIPVLDAEIEALEKRLGELRSQKPAPVDGMADSEHAAADGEGSGGRGPFGQPAVATSSQDDSRSTTVLVPQAAQRQEEAAQEMAALRGELRQAESDLADEERELLALTAASAAVETELAGLENEIQAVTEELIVVETKCEAAQRELVALGGAPQIPTGKDVDVPVPAYKTEMTAADREQVARRLGVLERHNALP